MFTLIIDGTKIRVRMAHAGIHSLAELGRRADLHRNTVYQLADHTKPFSSTTVDAIANALGCSPLDLLSVRDIADTQPLAPTALAA